MDEAKKTIGKRIIASAAYLAAVSAGTIAAFSSGACGVVMSDAYMRSISVVGIIALSFFGVILVVEIVSAFKISDSTYHTVLLAGSIIAMYLASPDFIVNIAGIDLPGVRLAADIVCFAAFATVLFTLIGFWNYTYKVGFGRTPMAIATGLVAALVAAYGVLTTIGMQIVAFFALGVEAAVLNTIVCARVYKLGDDDPTFYITEFFFHATCGMMLSHMMCAYSLTGLPSVGFFTLYYLVLFVCFAAVYVTFGMRTDRQALKSSEYRLKYEQIKARALREQIKPHFIFNVLAAIQSLYHRNIEDGDYATALLSKHLRNNIEAATTDLIPFEKELDNIQVYIDLENMRWDKKFNVIFDIDYIDFFVPILSLQPYIENAIKYSRVNEKPNGYIVISSRKTDEGVRLEVYDNGVGFDPATVDDKSCGLKNSRERLLMLLGAEPKLTSTPGVGTRITIDILDKQPLFSLPE